MDTLQRGLIRVTFRHRVNTICPHTLSRDENEVEVSLTRIPAFSPYAEVVQAIINEQAERTVTAEDLACELAVAAQHAFGGAVRVVVRQVVGHGVEAEAIA